VYYRRSEEARQDYLYDSIRFVGATHGGRESGLSLVGWYRIEDDLHEHGNRTEGTKKSRTWDVVF
jgi:hypothetical protein